MVSLKSSVLSELPAEENMEEDEPAVTPTRGINVGNNSSNEEEEIHSRNDKTEITKKRNKRKFKSSFQDEVEVEECYQKNQEQELRNEEKESFSPKLKKYKKIRHSFDSGNIEDCSAKNTMIQMELNQKESRRASENKLLFQDGYTFETLTHHFEADKGKKKNKENCNETMVEFQFVRESNIVESNVMKDNKMQPSFGKKSSFNNTSVTRNKTIADKEELYMKHEEKRKKFKNCMEKVVLQESEVEETVASDKKKRKKVKFVENEDDCQFPEREIIKQLERSVKKKKKKSNCRDKDEKQEVNIFISDEANAENQGKKKSKKSRENIVEQSEGNTEVTNYKDGNLPNVLHQIKISDTEKGKKNNRENQGKEKKELTVLEDVETEPKKLKENSHLLHDQCNNTAVFNDKKNKNWLDLDVIKFFESSIYPEAHESLEIRSKRRSKNSLEIINKISGIKLFRKNPDGFAGELSIDENIPSESCSVMKSEKKSTRLDLIDTEIRGVNPESTAEKEGCSTDSCWESEMARKHLEGDQGYVEDRETNKQYEFASSNQKYVNVEKVRNNCETRNKSLDIEFKSDLDKNYINSNYVGNSCDVRKDAIKIAKIDLKTKAKLAATQGFKGGNLWQCKGYDTKARKEALGDVEPEGQSYYLKPKKIEFTENSHLLSDKNISYGEKKQNWLTDSVMNLAESRVCPGKKSKILAAAAAQAFKGANLWQCKGYDTKVRNEPKGQLKSYQNPKKKEFTENSHLSCSKNISSYDKKQNWLTEHVMSLSESRACPKSNEPIESCKKTRKIISDLSSKLNIINKMFRKKLDGLTKDISNENICIENSMDSETKSTPLDCIDKDKVVYLESTSDRGGGSVDSCWESGMAPQVHKVDQINVEDKETMKHYESCSPNTEYVTKEVRSKGVQKNQNEGNEKQFMYSEYESCMNVNGRNGTSVGKCCSGEGKDKLVSKNYLRNNKILSGAQAFKGANLWQYGGYDI